MSKFRPAPKLQSEEAFIKGAEGPRSVPTVKKASTQPQAKTPTSAVEAKVVEAVQVSAVTALPSTDVPSDSPWEAHDPASRTTSTTQPLRLNAYQYEQLKWLAETQDRSLAQILRRLVAPALEDAVRSE